MNALLAVYYREMLLLWRRLPRQLVTLCVSPLLYLVAFGYGLGQHMDVNGVPYLRFLLPGLVAMASMTQSFALASDINIARFYWKIFEEIQAAPVGTVSYVMGEVLAAVSRGVLAAMVILLLAVPFGVGLHCGPLLWLAVVLNSFVFGAFAVCSAMLVASHGDQALISSLVITPMAFLGGTFFPVDRMPEAVQGLLSLLPLTHAAHAIRAAALGQSVDPTSYLLLAACGLCAFALACLCVQRSTR